MGVEDNVKKGTILVMGLMTGGLMLLAGCQKQGSNGGGIPVGPLWKGAPYRLALVTEASKPKSEQVLIPDIKYTANPKALETRAILVVRFDNLGDTKNPPTINKMIMSPFNISGTSGTLPADYIDAANKDLTGFLRSYCINGKVKLSVALARSSLTSGASDAEVDSLRMSDWLPVEAVFKNPHPKC
jgi:hypothetical protein